MTALEQAVATALSAHMPIAVKNYNQIGCTCGETFIRSANPHLLHGEQMWHLAEVAVGAVLRTLAEPGPIRDAVLDGALRGQQIDASFMTRFTAALAAAAEVGD